MKKAFLLILAVCVALILCEFTVRFIIGFPPYGVDYKVHYRNGVEYWSNIMKPYTKIWNVESGNKVFQINNLGLPGIDVDSSKEPRLAVLGSSIIEATQMKQSMIATSILDSLINNNNDSVTVYNLGHSGHDPYDSWFRLEYFKQYTSYDYVILVLNSDNKDWLLRHPRPLSFKKDRNFGQRNESKVSNLAIKIRNSSSLVSVLVNGFKKSSKKNELDLPINSSEYSHELSPELMDCLNQYNAQYSNKFALVSIVDNADFNENLMVFSQANKINFVSEPLLLRKYMFHGAGHLNERGNSKLGILLFKAYIQFFKK